MIFKATDMVYKEYTSILNLMYDDVFAITVSLFANSSRVFSATRHIKPLRRVAVHKLVTGTFLKVLAAGSDINAVNR